MLPNELLAYQSTRDEIRPEFLRFDAHEWVDDILCRAFALAHAPALTFDRALDETIFGLAKQRKIGMRALRGVENVVRKRWSHGIASALPPPRAREVLFGLAAHLSKEEALVKATEILAVDRGALLASLFADRPERKRMIPPDVPPTAEETIARYNLALVEALLARSIEVVVRVRAHVGLVVRMAKNKGLMVHVREDEEATELRISGPLSLLRDTTKYGHALAAFFPTVLATPGWSLAARVRIDGTMQSLVLGYEDPLCSPRSLPVDVDTRVGRRLARDLRKMRKGWELVRESVGIPIDGHLFFPDYTLLKDGRRVLLEIVGFWTEEYLREKLHALRACPQVVVCVDASIAKPFEDLGVPTLPFEKAIDATRLLGLIDGM